MRALPFGFGVILAAMIGVIVMGVITVRADLGALQQTAKENIFWSAAQVEREFNALQVTLARHRLEEGDDGAEVRRRFDILWSRVSIFGQGDVGKRLDADPEVRERMAELFAALKQIDPQIQALGSEAADAKGVADVLFKLEKDVRRSTIDVLHADEERFSLIRTEMRQSLLMTASAVAFSMLIAFGLTVVFFKQSTRQTKLARELREAGEGRARFFELMSHELRTPLNGMIGALALLRGERNPEIQDELTVEAYHSARRLSDLLTDAIDLGARENEETATVIFSLANLAKTQQEMLAPELRRREMQLSVSFSPDLPGHVMGDFRRISHAITYLILNAIQRGGAREVALSLGLTSSGLRVEINSAMMAPESAFGETLAQSLIQRIGGSIERAEGNRIMTVPVERVNVSAAVDMGSAALRQLYTRLLRAEGVELATDPEIASMILVDVGTPAAQVSMLRKHNAALSVIACGDADNASAVDGLIRQPGDLPSVISDVLNKSRSSKPRAA